jgi:hypothetical protein
VNLVIASFYVKAYPRVFGPLNKFLLEDWFRLYGKYHPGKIWWLLTLSGLLIAFGVNIAVCNLDRLRARWSKRGQLCLRVFFLRVSPSLIHICFFIVLTGHFLSMVSGSNRSIDVIPGQIAHLHFRDKIMVLGQQCDYYDSPEILRGFDKQCTVSLDLETPEEKTLKQISFLHPFFWQGLSFHLVMDKKAGAPKMKLIAKDDPGAKLIVWGFTAMVLLMVWYFPQINIGDKRR